MNEILGAIMFVRKQLLGSGTPTADQAALRALVDERVYAGTPPSQNPSTKRPPVYPMVLITVRAATDKIVVGGASAFVSLVVDVKTVGTGSYTDLAPIDSLVFRLLQQTGGTVAGDLEVMGCYREQVLMLTQVDDDTTYRSLVQSFRIRISRIS